MKSEMVGAFSISLVPPKVISKENREIENSKVESKRKQLSTLLFLTVMKKIGKEWTRGFLI